MSLAQGQGIVAALAVGGAGFAVAALTGAGIAGAAACTATAGLAGAGGTLAFGRWTNRAQGGAGQMAAVNLAGALPEWKAGRREALQSTVAQLAGPAFSEHGQRCAALAAMLADQLAIPADETEHLTLAAALHVLPAAFPADEDGSAEACAFPTTSLIAAYAAFARIAPPEVARIAAESFERWDGSGLPNRLVGEQVSISGRVVAAVCAFDHASVAGLEPGLDVVRAGSATLFDPVVVAELIHLFRQPWQQRQAA